MFGHLLVGCDPDLGSLDGPRSELGDQPCRPHRLGKSQLRRRRSVDPELDDDSGRFLLSFGGNGSHGGSLSMPAGIAIDHRGRIAVADSLNNRVQLYQFLSQEHMP